MDAQKKKTIKMIAVLSGAAILGGATAAGIKKGCQHVIQKKNLSAVPALLLSVAAGTSIAFIIEGISKLAVDALSAIENSTELDDEEEDTPIDNDIGYDDTDKVVSD